MTDKNPYRTLHARMSPPGAAWDEGFAAGRAAATPTGENPDGPMTEALWKYAQNEWGWGADDYEACRDAITAVVAAGRAAATPDPPSDRNVARMFHEAYERLAPEFGYHTREESAVPWERVPARNRDLMTATVGAVRAHLAAASPDERLREAGVWPDQSAMHGVLLDQIKDAYAEGIADTIDRIRVRAAEMLPEVARFTLDEIEALAAADREKPDEPIHQPDPVAADLGHPEVPDATTPEES